MSNELAANKFRWIYMIGFFIILALPILALPPYFFPPDFAKNIIFRSILTILLGFFAVQFLFKNPIITLPDLKKNIIFWPFVAFFSIFLLATIFSVDSYFSLWGWPIRGGGFINLACYGVFAMIAFIFLTKHDWQKVWDFSIIIGGLVSLIGLFQYYGLFSNILIPTPDRVYSTMGNPILLAIYLLLLSFLALSFAIAEKKIWKKAFYIIHVLLFSYVILLTGSRAAYLGILGGIIYFFLWYPVRYNLANNKILKRFIFLKILISIFLVTAISMVLYINTTAQYPLWLTQNRLFNSVVTRLSFKNLTEDARLSTLQIEFNMIKAKPVLGYGPENFSVGFNQQYNPATTNLKGVIAWWDRAHNIIMQTASDAGILGLAAYLALLGALFWQLHKVKSHEKKSGLYTENTLASHGIQAALIGYTIANLFSFDSFGSYLIFFLLIGYSLHITSSDTYWFHLKNPFTKKPALKYISMGVLFFLVTIFLWKYNIVPIQINAKINRAGILASQQNCQGALSLMEEALQKKSFLDSYARLQYVDITKTCIEFFPQNVLMYKKRGLELIKEASAIQPLYTRYWIFMAGAANDLASTKEYENEKSELINEAYSYLNQATKLAPGHQEIPIGKVKIAINAKDYVVAKQYANDCITLDPDSKECYFYLGLVQIYTKEASEAQKNLQLASTGYSVDLKENLEQLSNAYGSVFDYQNLVLVYEKLVSQSPKVVQYHSSLAFFYKEVGKYKEARFQALKVLELSPDSKENVEAFLKTLPR